MHSSDYVLEKVRVAIACLCAEGAFSTRLVDATVSALIRLEPDDLPGNLEDDLAFILKWTKDNMADGRLQREPDEATRRAIVSKLLDVFANTHRA